MEMEEINQYFSKFPNYSLKDLFLGLKDNSYKLKIEKVEAENSTFPRFHWYNSVLSKSDSLHAYGTGEHYNQNLAKIKSIGEAVERFVLTTPVEKEWVGLNLATGVESLQARSFKTSNGCAYHTSVAEAFERALLEKIERHTVLEAWLQKKNIFQLGLTKSKYIFISKVNSFFKNLGVNFYFLKNQMGIPVVVCCIENRSQNRPRMVFGFGCHYICTKAIEKSFYEAWRFYINCIALKKDGSNQVENKFVFHFDHYNENNIPFEDVFKVSQQKMAIPPALTLPLLLSELPNLRVETYECKKMGLPGYVVRVLSDDLIDLWSGPLKDDQGLRKKGDVHPIA